MKVTSHATISLLLSLPAAYVFGPLYGFSGCLIGGVLIDTDHLVDYFINYKIPFGKGGFFSGKLLKSLVMDSTLLVSRKLRSIKRDREGLVRSFLIFHSIELWIMIMFFSIGSPFIMAVAVGGIVHLISDYCAWGRPWYAFSFIYRAFCGFDLDEFRKYKEQLKEMGVNVNLCNDCGAFGEHEIHYLQIDEDCKKGSIKDFIILCPECHDKRHVLSRAI